MGYEQRRQELWQALRTRVLTKEEWHEVLQYGANLNIEMGVPYYRTEKTMELTHAYMLQFIMHFLSKD